MAEMPDIYEKSMVQQLIEVGHEVLVIVNRSNGEEEALDTHIIVPKGCALIPGDEIWTYGEEQVVLRLIESQAALETRPLLDNRNQIKYKTILHVRPEDRNHTAGLVKRQSVIENGTLRDEGEFIFYGNKDSKTNHFEVILKSYIADLDPSDSVFTGNELPFQYEINISSQLIRLAGDACTKCILRGKCAPYQAAKKDRENIRDQTMNL